MGRNRGVSLCLWIVIGCGDSGGTTAATTTDTTGGSSSSGSSTPTSSGDPPTGTAETSGITGDLSATGTSTTTTGEPSTGTTSALTSTDSTSTGPLETTTGTSTDDSTGIAGDDSTGDSSGGSSDESTGDPPVLEPFDVLDLDAGHGHVCAVLASHQLKCWGGYNDSGGLGLGDDLPRGTMPGTMGNNLPALELGNGVSAGAVSSYYHGCVVLADDKLNRVA